MSKLSPDYVILGLLELQSCHGYQLLEHFRDPERLGTIWNLSTSQLYAILKRLERKLWIDGREESSVDAPIRTVYWLTPAGRTQLNDWLTDETPSASTRHIRTEFLSRLYVAKRLKHPITPIVSAQHTACQNAIHQLIAAREDLSPGAGYLAVDLRVAEMRVILEWIGRCAQACEVKAEADD